MQSQAPSNRPSTAAAIVLLCAGVVETIAMLFHPVARNSDAGPWVADLVRIAPLGMHVHLLMIVAVIAVWFALAQASRAWPSPGWAWLAARLYGLGAGAMIGAALINGFVVGLFAARVLPIEAADQPAATYVALLALSMNQVLAGFGTVLMSCGIAAWSLGLWRDGRTSAKLAAVYGVVMGLGCCVAYAIGVLRLDVHGMMLVVIAHGLWCALVGLWLLAANAAINPGRDV